MRLTSANVKNFIAEATKLKKREKINITTNNIELPNQFPWKESPVT